MTPTTGLKCSVCKQFKENKDHGIILWHSGEFIAAICQVCLEGAEIEVPTEVLSHEVGDVTH